MALIPQFDTPGVMLRFAAGPQLRAWLDTPDDRHLFRVDLALVEDETWQLYGAIDGVGGWTWHSTIAPRDEPPTRWQHQISIAGTSDLQCAVTIALTDLMTLIEPSDLQIGSDGTEPVNAALIDTTSPRTQLIDASSDAIFNTSLLLRFPHSVRAGQTLTIACDIVIDQG